MKLPVIPVLLCVLFIVLCIFFTNYFNTTLLFMHLNANPELVLFISSPFNISTELQPLYTVAMPAFIIVILGVYLDHFNKDFQKKCNIVVIFVMGILASYMKSVGSLLYYKGYANYGISLGTSIITLAFIATFVISLEVYIRRKQKFEPLYGHFIFTVISALVVALAVLIFLSFFATSSYLVHLVGLVAFLILFVPFYERHNIAALYDTGRKSMSRKKSTNAQG